jgi:hypothetical protein
MDVPLQPADLGSPIPFTRLGGYQGTCSVITKPSAEVFSSKDDFEASIRNISFNGQIPDNLIGNVDFSTESAIIVTTGAVSGGIGASVDSITKYKEKVTIIYRNIYPEMVDFSTTCNFSVFKMQKQAGRIEALPGEENSRF